MIDGTDQPPAFEFRAHDMRVFLLLYHQRWNISLPSVWRRGQWNHRREKHCFPFLFL